MRRYRKMVKHYITLSKELTLDVTMNLSLDYMMMI